MPARMGEIVANGLNPRALRPGFDEILCRRNMEGRAELQTQAENGVPIDDVVPRRLAGAWPRIRAEDSARWSSHLSAHVLCIGRSSVPCSVFFERAPSDRLRARAQSAGWTVFLLRAPNLPCARPISVGQ